MNSMPESIAPIWTDGVTTSDASIDRAATTRANSQHPTGRRTEAGKLRSSLNALVTCMSVRSGESEPNLPYVTCATALP